jgi:hypothetical protein
VTGPDDRDPGPDRSDAELRRRRAEVFGDVLPESTRDDRDPDGSGDRSGNATDEWLRSNVPPHHG